MNMKKMLKCIHFASLHAARAESANDSAIECSELNPELSDEFGRISSREIRHANKWMELMNHFSKAGMK